MNTELATQGNKSLAVPENQSEEILRSDIVIPFMTLAQLTSDTVKDAMAEPGDICISKTGKKYGDEATPFDVVFLHYPKANWIYEKLPTGKKRFEYWKTVPRGAKNESDPWSFWIDAEENEVAQGTKGAIECRRVKQMAVYALALKDIEEFELEKKKVEAGELPDPNKSLTPFMVSFRSTSYNAAKEISTFFLSAKDMGVQGNRYSLLLGCKLIKGEDAQYYVYTVNRAKSKPVPKNQAEIVAKWVAIVSSGNVKTEEPTVDDPVVERDVKPLRNYAPGAN